MSYASLRARLADRNVKAGARGTVEVRLCLDVSAVEALEQAQNTLDLERRVDESPAGKARLGAPRRSPDLTKAEKAVEAAEAVVARETVRLVFRSLGSVDYNRLRALHADGEDVASNEAWLNAVCSWCLWQVFETDEDGVEQSVPVRPYDRETGEPEGDVEGVWFTDDIAPSCSVGEWDQVTIRVASLNNAVINVPLVERKSPALSPTTSNSAATSKRASTTASPRAASPAGSRRRAPSTTTTTKGG